MGHFVNRDPFRDAQPCQWVDHSHALRRAACPPERSGWHSLTNAKSTGASPLIPLLWQQGRGIGTLHAGCPPVADGDEPPHAKIVIEEFPLGLLLHSPRSTPNWGQLPMSRFPRLFR
jgi:hypothetical protein